MFTIISLSIALLNHEFPEELNFKTGAIIAVICYSSMVLSYELRGLESLAFTGILFSLIFLIGGFFGKFASQDKEKIMNKYWFWMIIIVLILSISFAGYSFYDSQFTRMNSVSQFVPTESIPITQEFRVGCSTDEDCEPNKCIHHSCHTIQEETLSHLTEQDWEDYWKTASNSHWSLIDDNGDYYLKSDNNDWLKFNYEIYNLSLIELKVNVEQGGIQINFDNYGDKKHFLEFGNEHIEITKQESQEYTLLNYSSLELTPGTWNKIRIEIEDKINVYLNEELIFSNISFTKFDEDLIGELSISSNEDPIVYIDDLSYTSGGYEPVMITP